MFGSSDGGDAGLGQVWQYTPTDNVGKLNERGRARAAVRVGGQGSLDGPDNMCTSPGGAIVIAEDGNLKSNFVQALLPDGTMINDRPRTWSRCSSTTSRPRASSTTRRCPTTARSAGDGIGFAEFAGPCFSPDGKWLFVNIQVPGITCAITGDWASLGSD